MPRRVMLGFRLEIQKCSVVAQGRESKTVPTGRSCLTKYVISGGVRNGCQSRASLLVPSFVILRYMYFTSPVLTSNCGILRTHNRTSPIVSKSHIEKHLRLENSLSSLMWRPILETTDLSIDCGQTSRGVHSHMDTLKKAVGMGGDDQKSESQGGLGGIGDKLNAAAVGGSLGGKNEGMALRNVSLRVMLNYHAVAVPDAIQGHGLGQSQNQVDAAVDQADREQISEFLRSKCQSNSEKT